MNVEFIITSSVADAVKSLYGMVAESNLLQFQKTKKEFEGDITVVTFPFVKAARKSPEQTGQEIGEFLLKNTSIVSKFNVIKGFLNLSISKAFWFETLDEIHQTSDFGITKITDDAPLMMIEYSSPNTNKPLH